MLILPFDSPESSLEKDAKLFIEEEDDLGEAIDLPTEEVPAQPLVELKFLPAGLRYVFLNGDKNTLVIISDKLSDEGTSKLIAILEKHRSVFGYSLQDPTITPSREPQCRLNNAIREVMKKEVLKLLHAGIIYHVPHSD
jgi:hypothetical protein